jgi:mono/diheme cytochrome c family protein
MRFSYALICLATVLMLVLQAQTRGRTEARPLTTSAASAAVMNGNIEHGRYLTEQVAMCVECHSGRDEQGTIIPADRYMGGAIPPGPPWSVGWANRAPRNKGLPGYNDDQALRLLMQGAINREGRQLQPPMPRFRMTAQDAADVIAFLRSLP